MNCEKVQTLFDDLSENRLDPETAARVRQHLADCTDCRVLEQRAARLQRLLALKRYERPSPEYRDGFLSEFHQRLAAETQRTPWWERAVGRIDSLLVAGTVQVWRYGLASAMGVAVVVGVMWMSVRQPDIADNITGQTASTNPSVVLANSQTVFPPSGSPDVVTTSLAATATLQAESGDYQATPTGGMDLVPAATRADDTVPRYVLDRITPASYEVSSYHF
ncbi:MAG TPA: zf-HC2 domain-containing protein [Verrucomicrobiae bacterium]|nr:zf-HC2 domain-containing protein [Verrucomicrobiae bacterium]